MQPVFRTASSGTQHKRVIFMLTGWGNKLWMYRGFARILVQNGFHCIVYEYDSDVLSPDAPKTVKCLTAIRDDILQTIKKLKAEGATEFSVFGTSLGSVIALMVADHSHDVSKIILNTIGLDIAETVWGWDHQNPAFKQELLRLKYNLESLRKQWEPITPSENINHLNGKKMLVFLARFDAVIPYVLGKKLIEAFAARKYDYEVRVNPITGHILTATQNLFNAPVYLRFLNTPSQV